MDDREGNNGYGERKHAQIADFYANLGISAPRTGFGPAVAAWFNRASLATYAPLRRSPAQSGEPRRPSPIPEASTAAGEFAGAAPPAAAMGETPAREREVELGEHVLTESIVTHIGSPFTPPDLVPDEPQESSGLQIGNAPGDEGGTVQIAPPELQRSQTSGPSWWTRHKAAAARRRARAAGRPQRSRPVRFARASGKLALYSMALVYGVGNLTEPLAAAALGGGSTVADALAHGAGIMIEGSGTRPVFARPLTAKPDDANRAHLPEAARESDNHAKTAYMAAALEDKRALASPWSLDGIVRVHGTDTLGLARAAMTQIAAALHLPVKRRGGSTMPVTACSIAQGSMKMPDGLIAKASAKFDEHVCAARLEGETRGNAQVQAGMLLDNAPLVIGGGADVQGVTLAARQLFSKDFAGIDSDCHLAVLAAAINKPFLIPGQSAASQNKALTRLVDLSGRAQTGLSALRRHQDRMLDAADKACLAALPALLTRRYRNPAGDLNRAFGAAAPQIAKEAFAFRAEHPGTVKLTARFDAFANEGAIQRVSNAACEIAARKHLLLNICPRNAPLDGTQVRVIAVDPDGMVQRLVAIGVGASSALSENENGELPGRGSVGKGILLPILGDNLFCRFDYPLLVDSDGVAGVDHACRPDELTPPVLAVKHSLNQPFLYALEHTDQARLARYRNALDLPQNTLRDLVLGNHPPAMQILLRDYAAITSLDRTGSLPHFIVEAAPKTADLSAVITDADVARTRQLLAAPAQEGGTAYAAAVRLRSAGFTVSWAKSGTSEAGLGTLERGKHLVLELVDPSGKVLIVFAEIASADSSAIAASKVLSSADLAELIIATLQSET